MKAARRKQPQTQNEADITRQPLDLATMVRVALAMLDEDGLEKLTMRRLAERLGVKPASLYWHIQDKDDLLNLLAEELCTGMQEPDPTLSWRDQLQSLMLENRRVLLSHRDAALVLINTLPTTPNRLRLVELVLGILLRAGFKAKEASHAGFLVNDYTTNLAAEESRAANAAQAQELNVEQVNLDARAWFQSLPPDKYPSILAIAEQLTSYDNEARFLFGLKVLLDGLEINLSRAQSEKD